MTEYWKKQMEHELTKGYHDGLVELIKLYKPETVLEIGTGWGISGSAFMDNGVKLLVTVDASNDLDYLNVAAKEIETHVKEGQDVEFNLMKSSDFFAKDNRRYDMVFIDGDHSHDGAKEDLLAALLCVKPGGKIVMDDYLHIGNHIEGNECRVAQAAREVLTAYQLPAAIFPHNKENGFLVI